MWNSMSRKKKLEIRTNIKTYDSKETLSVSDDLSGLTFDFGGTVFVRLIVIGLWSNNSGGVLWKTNI